jgi:hypothetical protein
MWANGKSLKIWHTGWQLGARVTDKVCTLQTQFLHLQCFSKWESFYTNTFKDESNEVSSFARYNSQFPAIRDLQAAELLQHRRYL